MSDYKGLDENLISTESPQVDVVSSYDYNSRNDRNNVTSYNIQELNAGKINSGTITVGTGGTVAGLLRVLDSSGGTIVTADSNGLTVNNGSITIKDTGGTTVIDYLGLNSGNNFYSDAVTGGSFETTSTVSVNVTGGSLSSLVLSRDTKCILYVVINGRNKNFTGIPQTDDDCAAEVYDSYIGGTIPNFIANFAGNNNLNYGLNELVTIQRHFTFAAGTHDLNLQLRSRYAGTARMAGWEIGLIKLGD